MQILSWQYIQNIKIQNKMFCFGIIFSSLEKKAMRSRE